MPAARALAAEPVSQSEIENVGGGREDSEDRGKLAASVGNERSSSDRRL